MTYLPYIPSWYQKIRKRLVWRLPANAAQQKVIYLSFDDGPIPGVTPWVLEQLKRHQATATFFCIGENVEKHPSIFEAITAAGHQVGNHTQHHLNGNKFSCDRYVEDVAECNNFVQTKLFRPPFGRISPKQTRALSEAGYKIIMWDSLAGDWDPERTAKQCFQNIVKHAHSGSIIVFHDSLKAWPRLQECLPQILEYYRQNGYLFKAITLQNIAAAAQ
jgi:peptidoglycan/xylan/chitin deacetylase (PgdA/CDA1 family)